MALDSILAKLHEERDRLRKELDRVMRMIKAAGKGAEAAIQEYRRRSRAAGGPKARIGAANKRIISAAMRKKMAASQRARRSKERAAMAKKPRSSKTKPVKPAGKPLKNTPIV